MKKYIGILSLILIAAGCSESVNDKFQRIGYLKDNVKNRIFTIAYLPSTSEYEIKTHAHSLMHTDGQVMTAYFYQKGSLIPADGITLSGSLAKANDVLYEMTGLSKWNFAYIRYLNGSTEFVNCQIDNYHDLCRKI